MDFSQSSPQLQTVLNFLEAISNQDVDGIMDLLTEDHQYIWIAQGFDEIGPQVKNREQTQAFFSASFGKLFKDFKFTIFDYVEMPGKIAIHCTGHAQIMKGSGALSYDNRYMWFFHLSKSESDQAPKIQVAKEFFDSLYCAKIWGVTV